MPFFLFWTKFSLPLDTHTHTHTPSHPGVSVPAADSPTSVARRSATLGGRLTKPNLTNEQAEKKNKRKIEIPALILLGV